MNTLERIAHLAATDPDFRQALQADPQATVTAQGLSLSAEQLAAVRRLRHLLAMPPEELAGLLVTLNYLLWGSVPPGSNLPSSRNQIRAVP